MMTVFGYGYKFGNTVEEVLKESLLKYVNKYEIIVIDSTQAEELKFIQYNKTQNLFDYIKENVVKDIIIDDTTKNKMLRKQDSKEQSYE